MAKKRISQPGIKQASRQPAVLSIETLPEGEVAAMLAKLWEQAADNDGTAVQTLVESHADRASLDSARASLKYSQAKGATFAALARGGITPTTALKDLERAAAALSTRVGDHVLLKKRGP